GSHSRGLPKPPKPVSKMRMATPLLMQALPMGSGSGS
nr:Chain C, CLIP peptide [Homo sapiens]